MSGLSLDWKTMNRMERYGLVWGLKARGYTWEQVAKKLRVDPERVMLRMQPPLERRAKGGERKQSQQEG